MIIWCYSVDKLKGNIMNLGKKLMQRMIELDNEVADTIAEREKARRAVDELNRKQVIEFVIKPLPELWGN